MSMESPNNVNNIDPTAAGGSGTASGDVAFTDTAGALSVESSVADGASAVAFSLGTSTNLNASGSKLVGISNGGVEVNVIKWYGGIEVGKNVGPAWAPDENDVFVGVHDVSQGEAPRSNIYLANYDNVSSPTNQASFAAEVDSQFGGFSLQANGISGSDAIGFNVSGDPGQSLGLTLSVNFLAMVEFSLLATESSTPYRLDTPIAHTSGNLFEIGNLGTNQMSVAFDGAIKAGGTDAWKLGSVVTASVTPVTDKYVEVNIGGTIVKLAVVE